MEDLERLRLELEKKLGLSIRPRRIRAIRVNSAYRWQPELSIEVGAKVPLLEKDAPPKEITAIFESSVFLVCTTDRDSPYIFTRDDVRQVAEG
ncbi:MAG: hypothetical protein JSU65_12685 [Candidatus Zixiibacteriota bacterium]|nr:MAG: hypothetical protein JSU65_12685 [candidate division Zixibacteria bacterium]